MKKKATRPIRKKGEVQESNDERIDQDYPGFPHHPSKKETISHNGSANAFKGTEYSGEDGETRGDNDGSDGDNDDRPSRPRNDKY